MNDIVVMIFGIIFSLILLVKLPTILGRFINFLGFKPDMSTNMSTAEKLKFNENRLKHERKAMPEIFGLNSRFGH